MVHMRGLSFLPGDDFMSCPLSLYYTIYLTGCQVYLRTNTSKRLVNS